jgi:branched-chain amino acid transport system substrate-binding protein
MNSKFLHKLCILAAALIAAPTLAQNVVKIGILNDQSGPFASYQGIGSAVAAKMAVEDYGGKAAGKPVEIVAADHQNKTDIGIGIARRWYENENVDAIFDIPNSSIALAVAGMSAEKNKGFRRIGRRHGAPDRREVHPEHRALDL